VTDVAGMPTQESKTYVCGYLIRFSDGGEPEERVLHRGTLEECQRIGKVMLAVSYSGDRPDPKCEFVDIAEVTEYTNELMGKPPELMTETKNDPGHDAINAEWLRTGTKPARRSTN